MANQFIKPEKVINQALGLLEREIVLPKLVRRFGHADFTGAKNDTINLRIPSLLQGREYEWRTRTKPIVVDELQELSIPIQLNRHVTSAVAITDEELTLDLDDFGVQVAGPQTRAVANQLETYIATAINVPADYAHTVTWAEGAPNSDDRSFFNALAAASKYLNLENVPFDSRYVLLGVEAFEAAVKSPHLVDVDRAGAEDALRQAQLAKQVAGFTVVVSNAVPADFAVAFHTSAFAFGNVAPVVPAGVAAGATAGFEGLFMRWIRDYESDFLRDRSVFSAFAGAASIKDQRVLTPGDTFGDLTGKNARAVYIDFTPYEQA